MKKKWVLAIALVAVLALAAAPVVGAAPAEKATGSAGFVAPNALQSYADFAVFEAGAGDAGAGTVHIWDVSGFWYDVSVQFAAVEGDMAYAAGPITASSNPDLVGLWFTGAALDGGEPGIGADMLWGYPTTMDEAVANVTNRVTPGEGLVINSGNVQVHSSK